MEESLAREQTADRNVHDLLKDKSQPLGTILQAFEDYRQICLTNTFADFAHAQEHQARLWQAHSDGKRYFHDALAGLRKQGNGKSVESRSLAKLFKGWIRDTTHFYQDFIRQLNTRFGGITELEAIAHQVKGGEVGESSASQLSTQERAAVLASCHQTLVYIGDLWRYRASEKLDNTPDFGPAIGYYGLANTLRPSSGLGYHQQAVVALEQRAHLRSIYHLYRAIVVDEPHPLATKNLKLEFGKENADTLGFKPLQDSNPVRKNWHAKDGITLKSRSSDAGVVRVSEDEEMLARVKGLLDDGSYLAHEAQGAPIGIVGDRIYHGKALQRALAAAEEAKNRPPEPPKVKAKPAPLSYAAAAKSGRTVGGAPAKASNGPVAAPVAITPLHQVQATHMVDSLVEEDDGNAPVTPPQQHIAHPAIVTNGDNSFNDNGLAYAANHHADITNTSSYHPKVPNAASRQAPPHPVPVRTPPVLRNPNNSLTGNFHERFQSVSKLWDNEPSSHSDSSFPSGLPTGTLASPPSIKHYSVNHSRVNSANSIRSRASLGMDTGVIGNSWSSTETTPQGLSGPRPAVQERAMFRGSSEAGSPSLLFGASAGIWSVGKRRSGDGWYGSSSPPGGNGQVG
ncbi:hypothetical protein LTR48_004755 [Friedmanniomyces endolithicus]|uniref:DNA/RNA-binding domain-containing protein n=1 Tax=Rachicladosporium monterosium TaxID=1507873 RepID=A0ABR0L4D5_9PEZI|nr:hypothetical protein LTR48_004755 [Friedmanniomyces endolithicus]KAK5143340.1 hypothetical protein LTR32_004512 [Rachicladosporium monterosium]